MEDNNKEKTKFKEKHKEEENTKELEMAEIDEVNELEESCRPNQSDHLEEIVIEQIKEQQLQFNKPLIMSADKAVSTYGIPDLADYQRAVTYEIIFNSLLEKKKQAMKRDVEERKRNKRLKRKSIGRIFFAKRLFSSVDSRKTSILSESVLEQVQAQSEPSTPQKLITKSVSKTANLDLQQRSKSQDLKVETISLKSPSQCSFKARTRSKSKSNTASSESPKQTTTSPNDDSVTSTLSNSSDKVVKRNLLVQAQTHVPTEVQLVSSSSGDSKNAPALSNGNHTSSAPAPLSAGRTHDTSSLASGYENGTGARLHSSTMAEDSLTSIRDSIESLSFNSSRCTVSFGATEVIPQELDVNLYERIKAAKRQRILEAKSISAQCSPILPLRHVIKTMVHAPMSPPTVQHIAQPPPVNIVEPIAITTATNTSPSPAGVAIATRPRFLPNQLSYTDSIFESRNISRQNTSEDSANLTVSTLLNQSDSLSLHAPIQSFLPADIKFGGGRPVAFNDRFKSKSTSLLVATGNGRTRPPPLPPPPFETAQHSPIARQSPTTLMPQDLPLEQLQQLRITSNMRYNEYHYKKPKTEQQQHLEENVRTTIRSTPVTNISTAAITGTKNKTSPLATSPPTQSLHIVTVTTSSSPLPHQYPVIDTTDTTITMDASLPAPPPPFYLSTSSTTKRNNILVNGAIVASSSMASDTAKLHRMTSTSTGSSIAPTGCCTTTKSSSRIKEKQLFKPSVAVGQSGSDDEYRKKKRKYKRYHRCSDPVLVYPTPSGLQHCILSMPPNDPIQYPYTENYAYNMQLQMESDKNDDLEKIVPSDSTKRRHHKHRHHRHKKRHRHKKPKILVQDLETQEVKVIDPDDLPQRARWTIIATACLLLLMCLMLVGITLRMAPIIDDMVRQENERLMKETMDRARFGKNFTETASSLLAATTSSLASAAAGAHLQLQQHQQQQQQQQPQILLPQPQQYPLPHLQQIP